LSKNQKLKELFLKQMDQWIIVLIGAVLVGLIVLGVASSYTNATSSKLPNTPEMIQLFISGSIVGGFITWLLNNGYLHGHKLISMIKADVSDVVKEVGLKGGVETSVPPVAPSTATVSAMVGGFLNSMGFSTGEAGQEMNVGMPTF
jgi:hypothetical protein